jgi:benzoate-CoA ligase
MGAFNLFEALFPNDRASRVAVLYEHRKMTYAELLEEVARAAEILYTLGVGAGDRVAILLHDSPEFIASFVGAISLGAIAVPINTALRREEQRFILRDSGARTAIVEADAAQALFAYSPASSSAKDFANELPELKKLLLVQRANHETPPEIAGVRTESWGDASRAQIPGDFPLRAEEASPAFILYTSGSTGEPKGAIHRQADIDYTNRTYCAEVLRLREGDRLFSSSRLPFAYGLGNSFTFPLLNGFTTILCREKPLPEVIGRVFAEYQPTIFFGVPVIYRLLLDHHRDVNTLDCSSLRLCVSAGEALPAQLGEQWQRAFGIEVLDGIGSTEMLHMFMSNHEGEVRYGSSGRLLRDYDARFVDHEGNPTPAGDVGNLWVRGASTAIGYWQRPETSAQTFVDGWVRTGDLYRCDGDDFWWHMGRSDDCFKPTGQWVSPIEVESVLLRHEAVGRAAVVEGFDEHGLSCVCAFVVPQDGRCDADSLEAALRTLCETTLPRFKQPRRYIFVPELPYTATGKVQRFKLREQLRSERAAHAD